MDKYRDELESLDQELNRYQKDRKDSVLVLLD